MSYSDLEQCIQANISAPNNEIRKKAEAHLKELKKKHPQQFYEGVTQLIATSKTDHVRSFSAVLLKQNLGIFDQTFFKIPKTSQTNIKQLLLTQISKEKSQAVTTQIAEAVSHLTCLISQSKGNDWKELMPHLFSIAKSTDVQQRASFYIAIDKLSCNAMDMLRRSSMEQLRTILGDGLQDSNNAVRECALSAVISLLCSLNEDNELNYFSNIVPLLFKNISIDMTDQSICKTCEQLQVLTENQAEFFANSMQPIIKCLVAVTKHKTLEWGTRRLSMHLLVTLLNFHVNQIQNNLCEIAQQVIPLVFDFFATFDESVDWQTPDDDCEQVNFVFGAEILPVLTGIFGADIFLSVSKPVFDLGFSDNADWRQKLIALKTVEVTLEGCVELYESQLNNIVDGACKSMTDSNNYVKYAALSVIKQLSVVFGDDKEIFLMQFHEQIMQKLCGMLSTPQQHHRCVLIQVCDALAHFAYMDEENEIIVKYSSAILNGLYNLMKSNDSLVKSYALKATSVIISVIQDQFKLNEYKALMKFCDQLLRNIFGGQVNDETGLLRGRCMECIGGMLLVIDIDNCRQDAHSIIKFLLPYQKQEQANGASESYTYMIQLFAAIAEALTSEFTQYLEHVMPPLLQSAKKRTMTVGRGPNNESEKKQQDNNNGNGGDNMVMEEFGGFRFQVNTAELNEKAIAVQQFPRYAVCLEGAMLQYVQPIAAVLSPILKTRALSSEARRHAIETYAPLVNCLKQGLTNKKIENVSKWVTEFVEAILVPLIDGMNVSDEVDEFSLICKTIQDLLDYVDATKFTKANIIKDITEQIETAMRERKLRRELNEEKSIDLIDTDVEEDVEADLADTIVDLVAKLVTVFGEKYVDIFNKSCGKSCKELMRFDGPYGGILSDQILGVSLFTEMIHHGGEGNVIGDYIGSVIKISQHFLSNRQGADPQLIQSICYAIGIIATKKGLNAQHISKWLDLLTAVVKQNDAKSEENVNATENAISAIAKICKYYDSASNNQFKVKWMRMLPLMNDVEEREFCNKYLLHLLQSTKLLQGIVEGKNAEMTKKLLQIIAVSIVNNDKEKSKFQELFTMMRKQCDSTLFQQAITSLPSDLQCAFGGGN